MDITEIIEKRHSVRQYKPLPIEKEKRAVLDAFSKELSEISGLSIKIAYDDEKGFDAKLARYGSFKGVNNYIAVFGKKGSDEKVGYYGEALVLKAQEFGLNTCWACLTYNKNAVKRLQGNSEKLYCAISLGYGETQGSPRKSKTVDEVCSVKGEIPERFYDGVKAALLAPTAVNQQKFKIISDNGKVEIVKNGLGFYTEMDLGIVKYHFEKVTGIKVFINE